MTETTRSIDETELMDMKQVADYLGIQYQTFTAYVYRGDAPEPDERQRRTRLWSKETIDGWNDARPSTIRRKSKP